MSVLPEQFYIVFGVMFGSYFSVSNFENYFLHSQLILKDI
jgi:hypothetical protein